MNIMEEAWVYVRIEICRSTLSYPCLFLILFVPPRHARCTLGQDRDKEAPDYKNVIGGCTYAIFTETTTMYAWILFLYIGQITSVRIDNFCIQ